jgi:cob(I)alamin adenosyltransferase
MYVSHCEAVRAGFAKENSMKLDRIYTRGGDTGLTSLGDGSRVPKFHARVNAIGGLDEANAVIGVALLHVEEPDVRAVLVLAQNDLFDVGADICRPAQPDANKQPLRVTAQQVLGLEQQIDRFNEDLNPLTSFVLPGGSAASAYLHLARTTIRRAERDMAELAANEPINAEALKYVNRLSDLLFVLGRTLNGRGSKDVLWKPGANR